MEFLNKHLKWILGLLLVISIVLLVRNHLEIERVKEENQEYKQFMSSVLEANIKVLEENKRVTDSLLVAIKENSVIIITQKETYETVKKSPIKRSYSDASIVEWLKSYESGNIGKDTSVEGNKR